MSVTSYQRILAAVVYETQLPPRANHLHSFWSFQLWNVCSSGTYICVPNIESWSHLTFNMDICHHRRYKQSRHIAPVTNPSSMLYCKIFSIGFPIISYWTQIADCPTQRSWTAVWYLQYQISSTAGNADISLQMNVYRVEETTLNEPRNPSHFMRNSRAKSLFCRKSNNAWLWKRQQWLATQGLARSCAVSNLALSRGHFWAFNVMVQVIWWPPLLSYKPFALALTCHTLLQIFEVKFERYP